MIYRLSSLFKLDSKGKIREWCCEIEGDKYRTIAGVQNGKMVTSGWTVAKGKNVGRANETTGEEQALSQVESKYTKQRDSSYHDDIANVGKTEFFSPMLATKWEDLKDKITYPIYVQPKLDGVRCVITCDGAKTRNGKDIPTIPHIIEELQPLFLANPELILDGELYNHELKEDFNEIISIVRRSKPSADDLEKSKEMAQYHVYDLPSNNGDFLSRTLELFELVKSVQYTKYVATYTAQNEEDADNHYGKFMEEGYEGGMARLNKPYEVKRSKTLMKRKDFEDAEFEIVRIEEGQGNWAGHAKRVVFRLEDGRECGSGLKGNFAFAKKLLEDADLYVGGEVTVKFFTRTPDGMPRFPVSIALYTTSRDM
jgi:ATP-dependent DNA ligase